METKVQTKDQRSFPLVLRVRTRYDTRMDSLVQYSRFVIDVFRPTLWPLHIGGVMVTVFLVWSGFDWTYTVWVLTTIPFTVLIVADVVGFLIPIFLPLGLWCMAYLRPGFHWRVAAVATSYAVALGFTLSMILKAFTGRTSPPHWHHGVAQPLIDNSHAFNFGFMNEHVIGGWPSSHTAIAFALATTLVLLLPPRWYIRAFLYLVALFIGIGVTFGFHWFSEFVAGACLGIAIGLVVGRHYRA